MKNILQLFSLGLFAATLSSCAVNGGGYVGARPAYGHPRPSYHNNGYDNHRYSGSNRPSYTQSRPAPRHVGVNTRVNARVAPVNVRTSTGLGLF